MTGIPAGRPPAALLYGDVDLNLIDGSAVWLQSVALALARAGCAVTVVLKAPVRTDRLTAPLQAEPGVTVRDPHAEALVPATTGRGLTPAQAADLLAALDREHHYDLVVLRGLRLVTQVTREGSLAGRLWAYLTDIPQSVPELTDDKAAQLGTIAAASRYLLCQTEELRSFLEGNVAAACGKCVLLPPIVPGPAAAATRPERTAASPLRLVYTGKFAPRWNTYEMTQLPGLLADRGVQAELHMVGDKIHDDPADPGYAKRMRAALAGPAPAPDDDPPRGGIRWHGGLSRERAMATAGGCDIGLGWRHPSLDASLELSTKVLEFGILGLPVILNRTPMHEDLLGPDYPLFARDLTEVADLAAQAAADPALAALAASRTSAAAARFTMDAAAGRLRDYLAQVFPAAALEPGAAAGQPGVAGAGPGAAGHEPGTADDEAGLSTRQAGPAQLAGTGGDRLRVVVAGHDLKFFTGLLDHFRSLPGLEIRVDQWEGLGRFDPAHSAAMARWADVVICEWCGPNAVWYSRHKRRGSRLLVRLHRFELASGYPRLVRIKAVDQVVCVNRHYARLVRETAAWPASKVVTIPNALDTGQLDRPKLPGARHHLGLVGIVPSRKRLDLALDVLEELRRDDDRYLLFVKSGMPWEHWWVWRKQDQRAHYTEALHRIQRSPLLRDAVVFDEPGPDVAGWLRRVGFVLSTSDDESFHVAPAEGMASRAVPVVRHWPGAETVYEQEWLHRTPADMASAIARLQDASAWALAGERAREQAVAKFALDQVRATWVSLLTGDLPPAVPGPLYELLGTPG